MNELTSEPLSMFLRYIKDITTQYQQSMEQVNILDKETQDILHQIELGSSKVRNKYATRLSNVRKDRRKHKDFISTVDPLIKVLESQQYSKLTFALQAALGDMRKVERNIQDQKRFYTPRVIEDLTFVEERKLKNEQDGCKGCKEG